MDTVKVCCALSSCVQVRKTHTSQDLDSKSAENGDR